MAKILLAGDGWGAIAAFNSLKESNEHELYILTTDDAWKKRLTESGNNLVTGFDDRYDLIITAGWRPIIKEEVLETRRILNIHYSLLPAYRGFHGTVWAILNNEAELGLTIHRMNQFIDDGPIVYQYRVSNNFIDTATSYMTRFNEHIQNVLLGVVNDYLSGRIPEVAQDKSKASWVGRRKPSHCAINFNQPIEYQKSFFRALSPPYPLPYFKIKDQVFEVTEVGFHDSSVYTDRGRILNIDAEGVWISCKGGYLICKKIISQSDRREIDRSTFKIGQMVTSQ